MELTPDSLESFISDFQDKLVAEGNADQLAATFEAQGLRAFCGKTEACAIAVAMTNAIAAEFNVRPNDIEATVGCVNLSATVRSGPRGEVPTDEQLTRFITRFDSGLYPNLVHADDQVGYNRVKYLLDQINVGTATGQLAARENLDEFLLTVLGISKP